MGKWFALFTALLSLGAAVPIALAPPLPQTQAAIDRHMAALVASYPGHLRGVSGGNLLWVKGPATPIGGRGARSAEAVLAAPSIADIFAWPYSLGPQKGVPSGDPGRARPAAFFGRVYGDCTRGEVARQLVAVRWAGGRTVRFTSAAGAAKALDAVARDLDALGQAYARYLWPLAGTYNCRAIAGTSAMSMHGYGAAIDLSSRYGAYWRWGPRPVAAQTIPQAIIDAFERHGFIWGGKWAHFDSFHFEYRPELIRAARDPTA